ncbi:hypothetical protein [Paenibacillus dakarensis]|uniref:hypothetical protein n=1 Tax=Paenibacillus dakarensis TaxID=1527293 RepID=UPI001FE04C9E|nr:hypothetical protein [Paenibacillus dakarensis]
MGNNQHYTVEYPIDWIGKTTWVLSEAHPFNTSNDHTTQGIVISFTDITRYIQRINRLERALAHDHSLQELIPICAVCKHVRTAEEWEPVESYLESRMTIEFTHDICPACIRQLYPKYSSILDNPQTSSNNSK